MANRLSTARSPYLLAHAENPIHWWQWGEQAFAEAKDRNVPVYVSVGYSSCHWCHVMNAETFSDPKIAALLNQNFVAIKVDREERPDVDAVLMRATQAMNGQGGWPNSVFLTPEGKPFFAGTYFPPTPTDDQPSFTQVLHAVRQAWALRESEAVETADTLTKYLANLQTPAETVTELEPVSLVNQVLEDFDKVHAGFGTAPKFPNAPLLDALLVRTDKIANDVALITLEFMARGGIYDQIGGGFHRYTIDAGWQVPHFEKMLDDNALLLGTLIRGWRRAVPGGQEEQRELLERVIRQSVGWLLREMRLESGAFAASQNADASYYLWNAKMFDEVLSGNSLFAQGVFHVTANGNLSPDSDLAARFPGMSTLQFHSNPHPDRLRRVCQALLEARMQRGLPARDEKVISAWNGWLIDSLTQASVMMNMPEWLSVAKDSAKYLWEHHWDGNALARTSLNGEIGAHGVLSDYAACALGFARLSAILSEPIWLERAELLLDSANEKFVSPDGGYFDARQDSLLFERARSLSDNAAPSASSTMVAALRLTSALSRRADLAERADHCAQTLRETLCQAPRFAGWALADALEQLELKDGRGPAQLVIVDEESDPFSMFSQAAARVATAGSAIVIGKPNRSGFGGLFDSRTAIDHKPTGYLCRNRSCLPPITDWAELRSAFWGSQDATA